MKSPTQTHCFIHKEKLILYHDIVADEAYMECPTCMEEMLEDMDKVFDALDKAKKNEPD